MDIAVPTDTVPKIIDAIGVSTLARHLGHRFPSTVSSWKERGSIPVRYWPEVIEAARVKGHEGISIQTLVDACAKRAA